MNQAMWRVIDSILSNTGISLITSRKKDVHTSIRSFNTVLKLQPNSYHVTERTVLGYLNSLVLFLYLLIESISMARKALRLFESLKEYSLLTQSIKKKQMSFIIGRLVAIFYWISENLYFLSTINFGPINKRASLIFYCVMGLLYYFLVVGYELFNIFTKKDQSKNSLLIIFKDTLDNLILLAYFGILKDSWPLSFLYSIGSCLHGIITLLMNETLFKP